MSSPHIFSPTAHSLIAVMLKWWFYSKPQGMTVLTNNDILKKLRIAYSLTTDHIATMLRRGGLSLSNSEITAFFRPVDDKRKRFRPVSNDTLTVFLQELLNSTKVLPEEYSMIRSLLEDKACGAVIPEEKGFWLDQLIERKRG